MIRRARRRNATPPIDPALPPTAPLLATTRVGDRAVVSAVDDRAAALGIAPGMGVADARALVPDLVAVPADPRGDAQALDDLARWCDRYTPSVAIDGSDGLFLDITGAAHLQGGEAALMADLLARVRRAGLAARAGLADTAGAAWALARHGAQGAGGAILASGGEAEALAPLPVTTLRLAPATAERLNRVGLRRIGDLLRLDRTNGRAPLAARMGPQVWQRLDQALGRLDEPIAPRPPSVPHRAELAFAEPIATAEAIARAAQRLLATLALRFGGQGVGARQVVLTLYRADGTAQRLEIGTARPSRDPKHLFRLLGEKLDRAEPGFGIDLVVLTAPVVEPMAAVQAPLPALSARANGLVDDAPVPRDFAAAADLTVSDIAGDDLAALVDRLSNRLGLDRVWRLEPRESHRPERSVARVAAMAPRKASAWRLPPRPVRLFARPEPVDMLADDDAAPSLFRWRAHLHRVRLAEGPERLAPEWWLEDTDRATRDYWRIEDEEGRRFWLFQALPERNVPERSAAGKPAWFLHGEFA